MTKEGEVQMEMDVFALLDKISAYSDNAWRDMGLDDEESAAAFDDGRHKAAEDIAAMIREMVEGGK